MAERGCNYAAANGLQPMPLDDTAAPAPTPAPAPAVVTQAVPQTAGACASGSREAGPSEAQDEQGSARQHDELPSDCSVQTKTCAGGRTYKLYMWNGKTFKSKVKLLKAYSPFVKAITTQMGYSIVRST